MSKQAKQDFQIDRVMPVMNAKQQMKQQKLAAYQMELKMVAQQMQTC